MASNHDLEYYRRRADRLAVQVVELQVALKASLLRGNEVLEELVRARRALAAKGGTK